MKLTSRLREFKYWHVTRRTQKIVPWIARHLPKKLKYYVVVDGAVSVERNLNPSGVTAVQMMEHWIPSTH